MFSRRVPSDLSPNALSRARAELSSVPFDLTVSNPTLCRIPYPGSLLEPLGHPEGLAYRPDPMGIAAARQAIADEYAANGVVVDPRFIIITASTSEAYSFLFKLLCEPGDALLVPAPSYPLFEHLAHLDGLRAVSYPLDPLEHWQPDLAGLDASGARAVVAVHPNNPTGTYLDAGGRDALYAYCARRDAALIVDEVFHSFVLPPAQAPPSFSQSAPVLTFTLNGLSKYAGLPQLKLAWIVVGGPERLAAQAVERLAFLSDNYLSVGTPVQLALGALLRDGSVVRHEISTRCAANLEALDAALSVAPEVSLARPSGGWSAVIRFPNVVAEEVLALQLLREEGVAVHPGYFFDFPDEGYLSLSLLPPPEIFAEGVRRTLATLSGRVHG